MIGDTDPREEVPPVTAEMLDDILVPDRQVWTVDDLFDIPDDGHRYEIFDGSLLMSAAPGPAHQVAANRLCRLLDDSAPADVAAVNEVAIDLGEHVPIPDVVVGASSLLWDLQTRALQPSEVLLVVEVVSPSSISRDRVLKFDIYAKAGIPAYWTVELHGLDTPRVAMYELADGVYREVRTVRAGEEAEIAVPYPIRLRPADLVGTRKRG
jgi:Uma2 family endonuclease